MLRPYFLADGHGAPHGAHAPGKSSGDFARPLEGLARWSAISATKPTTNAMA